MDSDGGDKVSSTTNGGGTLLDLNNNNNAQQRLSSSPSPSSLTNSTNSKDIVESACKILLEQVLKKCPNVNLSSITIKTTSVPSSSSSSSDPNNTNVTNTTNTSANTTTQIIQLKPATLDVITTNPSSQQPTTSTTTSARKRYNSVSSSSQSSSISATISPSASSTTSTGSNADIGVIETIMKKMKPNNEANKVDSFFLRAHIYVIAYNPTFLWQLYQIISKFFVTKIEDNFICNHFFYYSIFVNDFRLNLKISQYLVI